MPFFALFDYREIVAAAGGLFIVINVRGAVVAWLVVKDGVRPPEVPEAVIAIFIAFNKSLKLLRKLF